MSFGGSRKMIVLSHIGETDAPQTPDAWLGLVGLIATKMLEFLPTEQDHWWFLVEQFDRSQSFCDAARGIMGSTPLPLHEVEYEGRRSENSYVGAANPGVTFLQEVQRDLARCYNADLAEVVVANTYVSYVKACSGTLNQLRMKYAVHFHNNCVSSQSFNFADQWHEVIRSLGGD